MDSFEKRVQPNGKLLIRVLLGYENGKPIRKSKTFPPDTPDFVLQNWAATVKYESDGLSADFAPRITTGEAVTAYQSFGATRLRKPSPRQVTPQEMIDDWLRAVEGTVAESTYKGYETVCRLYLNGKFKTFTKSGVERGLAEVKRKDGKPLAPLTMDKVRTVLKMILSHAVEENNLSTVPKLPRVYRAALKDKNIQVLSRTETDKLVKHLRESGELALETLAVTGLRIGELLALEPKHVLDGSIRVEQSLKTRWGYRDVKPPKTAQGYRTLKVPKELTDRLRASEPALDGFLFDIGQTGLTKRLKKHCKALELPELGLHQLRHNHSTYLLAKGVNVVAVSKRLGHHNAAFTLRTYAHLVPDMDSQLLDALP